MDVDLADPGRGSGRLHAAWRAAWRTRGVTLGASAAGVGAVGEALLFDPARRALGSGVLGLAVVLAAVAWRHLPDAPLLVPPAAGVLPTRSGRGPALRLAGIGGALLLTGGAILAWFADPTAIFGWQGLLWLAALALLVGACARWYPQQRRAADPAWCAARAPGPPWTRGEGALFVALVALALGTYTTGLGDIPWRFHADELTAYGEALRFSRGPAISLFTTTWFGTGLPSLWFALAGGVLRVAGDGLGGVRLGVALLGALTVVPLYGLARLAWGRLAAVLAAFALATTPAVVHYSRVAINNSTTAFAWTVCFYFLLRGLRSGRPGDYVWAGLAAGLSMYTYYGTRLLPFLLLAFVAYLAVCHGRAFRERIGLLALLPVGFVVGFGPLLAYFLHNPAMWAGRGLTELVVPAALPSGPAGWLADWQVLAPLLMRNFLGLSVLASHDSVYWAPFLLPAPAVLLLLGVGGALAHWRQPASFLLLLWLGSVLGLAGTLLAASLVPDLAHWVPAFPALCLALALPAAWWLRALRRLERGRRWWRAGVVAVVGGALALAAANAYTYLVTYPATVPPAFESAQGRFLASLGPGARVRFVGDSRLPYLATEGALLAPAVVASDLLNPSRSLPLVADPAHDLVFVFNDDETPYLPPLQDLYPGGQTAPIWTPGGPIAQTYRVPAALALDRYGVRLTLAGDDPTADLRWQGHVPAVGALPPALTVAYPVTATWSGAFFLAASDPVRLQVTGGPAVLSVQDQPATLAAPLALAGGWVPFQVRARLTAPAALHLIEQQGAGALHEIDRAHLWPLAPGSGLAVTVGGPVASRRIDSFVGASMLGPASGADPARLLPPAAARDPDLLPLAAPGAGPPLIRWAGDVYVEGGAYTMELRTDGRARLLIDGALVLNLCANAPPPPGVPPRPAGDPSPTARITLAPGWHAVALALDATGQRNGLEWTWTRPDGRREIVPPARLRHAPGAWPPAPTALSCAR